MTDQPYDSTKDTNDHINRVEDLLIDFAHELTRRGRVHDRSKKQPPEKELFDEYTPKLKDCTYGSPEYHEYLKGLKVALDHHYAHNSHHPEYFPNGMAGMSLLDVVEMLLDWKAASERHSTGDIVASIMQNQKRFGYPDMLRQIFLNTAVEMDWITKEQLDELPGVNEITPASTLPRPKGDGYSDVTEFMRALQDAAPKGAQARAEKMTGGVMFKVHIPMARILDFLQFKRDVLISCIRDNNAPCIEMLEEWSVVEWCLNHASDTLERTYAPLVGTFEYLEAGAQQWGEHGYTVLFPCEDMSDFEIRKVLEFERTAHTEGELS